MNPKPLATSKRKPWPIKPKGNVHGSVSSIRVFKHSAQKTLKGMA